MQLDGVRRKGRRAFGDLFSGLRKRPRADQLSTVDEASTDLEPPNVQTERVTPASAVSDKENIKPSSIGLSPKSAENTEEARRRTVGTYAPAGGSLDRLLLKRLSCSDRFFSGWEHQTSRRQQEI